MRLPAAANAATMRLNDKEPIHARY